MNQTPTLATRFARNTRVLRSDLPLAEDQMRGVAPSIFAQGKHASRSERYTEGSGLANCRTVMVSSIRSPGSPGGSRMIATAKVLTVVGSRQEILLPHEIRVDTPEMWVTRNEAAGEISLRPKTGAPTLRAFLRELRSQPATEEFIPPR
jgi:hypothetical protein